MLDGNVVTCVQQKFGDCILAELRRLDHIMMAIQRENPFSHDRRATVTHIQRTWADLHTFLVAPAGLGKKRMEVYLDSTVRRNFLTIADRVSHLS